jgi:hypothetical protein
VEEPGFDPQHCKEKQKEEGKQEEGTRIKVS